MGWFPSFHPQFLLADQKVLTAPRSPKVGIVGNVEVWRFWGWSKSQQGTQPRCVRVELRNWKILIEVLNLWEVGGPSDWVIFEKNYSTPHQNSEKNPAEPWCDGESGWSFLFFKGEFFSFMFAGGTVWVSISKPTKTRENPRFLGHQSWIFLLFFRGKMMALDFLCRVFPWCGWGHWWQIFFPKGLTFNLMERFNSSTQPSLEKIDLGTWR